MSNADKVGAAVSRIMNLLEPEFFALEDGSQVLAAMAMVATNLRSIPGVAAISDMQEADPETMRLVRGEAQ